MTSKKQIGKILHQSQASKNLIIKLEEQTQIGEYIFNKKGEKIGEVFDITGPVDSPLASIKLDKEATPLLPGQPVFTRDKRERKKAKRAKRKR